MKTYGAINPEQLARLFDMRKEIAERVRDSSKTKIEQLLAGREAATFGEAAYIIRNTEFVGWNDSMFKVGEIK